MELLRPRVGWPDYTAIGCLIAGVALLALGSKLSLLLFLVTAVLYLSRSADRENAALALIFVLALVGIALSII